MSKTKIDWVKNADGSQGRTWNPISGCTKISAGCKNCYAARHAKRFWGYRKFEDVEFYEGRLTVPLKRKIPTTYFVNSMSDLFHESVSNDQIADIFAVMAIAKQHTFQILTKRPERMVKWFEWAASLPSLSEFTWRNGAPVIGYIGEKAARSTRGAVNLFLHGVLPVWPLPNVWLGVSVEDQKTADERIPLLMQTPAAKRFLSCEPLLGSVDLDGYFGLKHGNQWEDCLCADIDPSDRPCLVCDGRRALGEDSGIDWVIVGGESGPGARPMHPDWARTIRDQCVGAVVPFFFKQMIVGGKKIAMPELDGRTWEEMPK